MILTRGLEKGNLDAGPGNLNFGYLRHLKAWWRLNLVDPPDIGWPQNGYDMTGVNLTVADILAGMRDGDPTLHFTAASTQYLRRTEADWRIGDSVGVLTALVRVDSLGGVPQVIFSSCDHGSVNNMFLWMVLGGGQLSVGTGVAGATNGATGSTVLVVGQCYHVVLMSDGSIWRMFVNGQEETLTPTGAGNNGVWFADLINRDSFTIGVRRYSAINWYFNGSILDPRYYSWAAGEVGLTARDIALDYELSRHWEI